MRSLPPLSALRAFEAAARYGSFKRAASELSVTPTAVSHQIKALEEHLGVRLFDRKTRQVSLTAPGRTLFLVLRDGFDAIDAAIARLRGEPQRPVITISATVAFVAKWLVPRLARFSQAHPLIDLRLYASDDPVDLRSGQADLAIRYGRGHYPGVSCVELLADHFAPAAHPSLGLREPAHLARATLIVFEWRNSDPAHPTWPLWFERAGFSVEPRAVLRFTDESHAIAAAVAGQGCALLSRVLVEEECQAGRLVQPFGPTLPGLGYYLLVLPQGEHDDAVRAARDWLLSEARAA
jgi:LysR family glycine cleavage system transcriptional activator